MRAYAREQMPGQADDAQRVGRLRDSGDLGLPEPLGPHRWRGVILANGVYHVRLYNSLNGSVLAQRRS